jgi:predicted Zn-dependent peptidase
VRGATRPGFYREHIDGERGYLRIGIPAPGIGDPDAAAFAALAALLGGGPGTRLANALTGTAPTGAIDAAADYLPGAGEGRIEIQATLQPGSNGIAAIGAVRRELARLATEPVPAEELHAFVTAAGSESVYLRDQVHYLGMSVGPDLILGPRPSLGVGEAELGALTPASVQRVAARWLEATGAAGSPREEAGSGAASAVAATRPAGASRSGLVVTLSSPSVPAVADPEGADPVPPASPLPAGSPGGTMAAASPAASASPSAPAAPSDPRASRMSVRRSVLDNGMTVLVAENADSRVFAAHLLIRDRAVMEPEDKTGIADVLHRLLPYGSLYLDGEGLSLKLRSLGARLKTVDDPSIPFDDYYNSSRYSYIRFETTHENWREGLGYLFTTFAYPRLDDTDVALAISEEMDIARKRQETPAAVARDLYSKTILQDGPLAHPVTGTPISLAAIKPDDLRAFHDRYFSPERVVLTIVSDVPSADVISVLNATFGRMKRYQAPAGSPAAPAPSPTDSGAPPVTTAEKRTETQTGRAQSQIFTGRIFTREGDDFPAIVVATTVLSQAIGRELRDARGLAYSAGCSLEDYGDRSWFTTSVGTKPENVSEAEGVIREVIRAFPGKDLEESVVERAVNSMRGSVAMRRMTRISQAYSLGFNDLLGRSTEFDAALDAKLADVKAADVKRVVGKYLDPDRMVTAVAK